MTVLLQALNPACSSAVISVLGEPVYDDFQHDSARMTDAADGSVVFNFSGSSFGLSCVGFLTFFSRTWKVIITRPLGYKTFFMLNSTKHDIFPAHKC